MNTSFKIVAKTVKLVPLQKKESFAGLKISKIPTSITKKVSNSITNNSKVPVYWNVSPPAVFVESYKDHSERLDVDPRFPPRNQWKFSRFCRVGDAYMKLSNKNIVIVEMKEKKLDFGDTPMELHNNKEKLLFMTMVWRFIQVSLIFSRN